MSAPKKSPLRVVPPAALTPEAIKTVDDVRGNLGVLETEIRGLAIALRAEINTVGDEDEHYRVSLAMWADRIARTVSDYEVQLGRVVGPALRAEAGS